MDHVLNTRAKYALLIRKRCKHNSRKCPLNTRKHTVCLGQMHPYHMFGSSEGSGSQIWPVGRWPLLGGQIFGKFSYFQKIAGYFLQKTESETSCNISGQNHFVLICCCNISSQIRFVLNCCCNISGQTERPEKTCYFWEEFHVFCTFQLILVLLMHIEYHFCKKKSVQLTFSSRRTANCKVPRHI